MTFAEWEADVPAEIKADTLWRVEAYRLALFLSDLALLDARKLIKERLISGTADQLIRAASKISSDIAEGYSRSTGKGRAVFYDYALGSTREARDWYYKARHVLGAKITSHRIALTTSIIRLELTMVSNERRTNRKLSPDRSPSTD